MLNSVEQDLNNLEDNFDRAIQETAYDVLGKQIHKKEGIWLGHGTLWQKDNRKKTQKNNDDHKPTVERNRLETQEEN